VERARRSRIKGAHQRQDRSVSDNDYAQEGLREQVGFQAVSSDAQPLKEGFGGQACAVEPELLLHGIWDVGPVCSAAFACQLQERR